MRHVLLLFCRFWKVPAHVNHHPNLLTVSHLLVLSPTAAMHKASLFKTVLNIVGDNGKNLFSSPSLRNREGRPA
jgi:hypothetical protein